MGKGRKMSIKRGRRYRHVRNRSCVVVVRDMNMNQVLIQPTDKKFAPYWWSKEHFRQDFRLVKGKR